MSEYDFDIWPVLEHYGWDLPAPRGQQMMVKCAVHDDSRPSCSVNLSKNLVYCFTCSFAGDALAVIRYYEPELTFQDAVRRAEEITGSSSESLSAVRGSGRRVSRYSRNNEGRRRYSPPRVRRTG